MSTSITCDILVPYAGSLTVLAHCLESLARAVDHARQRVWVGIDDPSQADGALALCKRHGARGIASPEPIGYRGTIERLLSLGEASHVAFLNCDTVVPPGSLDTLLERFRADDSLGLLAARIVSARHGRLDYCGMAFGQGTCIPLWHRAMTSHPLSHQWQEFQAVPDCFAVTSREIAEGFSPRDPAFPTAWGDIDLCLSLQAAGLRCACAGDVWIWHMRHTGGARRMANVDLGRAHLFAKWAAGLRYDLGDWLARSFRAALAGTGGVAPTEACLIDLLDPFDREAYLHGITAGLGVRLTEWQQRAYREGISYLPAAVGPMLMGSQTPLLFLAKNVDILLDNVLLRSMRAGRGDLVLDRYGNVEIVG